MAYLQHCAAIGAIERAELSEETREGYQGYVAGTTYTDGFRDERVEFADGTYLEVYREEVVIYHADGRKTRHIVPAG